MRHFIIFLLFTGLANLSWARQTCTITAASCSGGCNWSSTAAPACAEGGNANGATTIIINSGAIVNMRSSLNWSGTSITVNGELNATQSGWNVATSGDILVGTTGTMGLSTRSGTLSVNNLEIDGTFSSSAGIIINTTGDLTVDGTMTVANATFNIGDDLMVNGSLTTGAATITTGDDAIINGTLTAGTTTLNTGDDLTISGTLTTSAAANINVGNAMTIDGLLDMNAGNAVVTADTVTIYGGEWEISGGNPTITVTDGITILGDGATEGTFDVQTAPIINSDIIIDTDGNLLLIGNVNINGNVETDGSLADPAYIFVGNNAQVVIQGDLIIGDAADNSQDMLEIIGKIDVGTSAGCGYKFQVYGTIDATSAGNQDRIYICNQSILKGTDTGNDCNDIPLDEDDIDLGPVYCLANTFSGPITFTEIGVLPVELIYFSAHQQAGYNLCRWATATELYNSHFEVERSLNGREFESIAEVKGAGNSQNILEYSFEDHEQQEGVTYYRLKQVDIDGKFSYSRVAVVNVMPTSAKPRLLVFPNPSEGAFQVTAPNQNIQAVRIYDGLGRLVWEKEKDIAWEIDISAMPAGQYIVVAVLERGQSLRENILKR